MTGWTAIVPLKAEAMRKSRLAPTLDAEGRKMLAERLYAHVVGRIIASGLFTQIAIVSPSPPPGDFDVQWRPDEDLPINVALDQTRDTAVRTMVINADLPLLEVDDLTALAKAAEAQGCALAPDRHGSGTNALALMPATPFHFAFGPDSLKAHRKSAPAARIIERPGLACDIDIVDDIHAAKALDDMVAHSVAALLGA